MEIYLVERKDSLFIVLQRDTQSGLLSSVGVCDKLSAEEIAHFCEKFKGKVMWVFLEERQFYDELKGVYTDG